ncbi:hypothetical protein ABMC88_02865 [Sulfitobacter sp. HNIBRBA2951]|uniref:hypothetical protein n=1 Tax=Sulfitobacter aquimarinus TaxID=3158557 RepID=UPI0032DF7436
MVFLSDVRMAFGPAGHVPHKTRLNGFGDTGYSRFWYQCLSGQRDLRRRNGWMIGVWAASVNPAMDQSAISAARRAVSVGGF